MMTATDQPVRAALPGGVDAALERLSGAVARLQAAAERGDGRSGGAPMDDAGAAADRDAALARAARLADAHVEAMARLDRVEATVRAVARQLAGAPPEAPATGGEA